MLLDLVKVFIMKNWSFEMTAKLWPTRARRKKLADRKQQAIVDKRVYVRWRKMRLLVPFVQAAKEFVGSDRWKTGIEDSASRHDTKQKEAKMKELYARLDYAEKEINGE